MTNWANYGKWRHPEKRKEILENWENSKKMNKEQQQIIDEVYDNYKKEIIRQRESQKKHVEKLRSQGKRLKVTRIELLTKDEFIDKIKTNTEFSEKWGLQIEEREILKQIDQTNPMLKGSTTLVPTKLITLTYNNETIENYES